MIKKITAALLSAVLALQAQAALMEQENALTEENRSKLDAPLVREEGGVYRVETFGRLKFTQPVMFDGKSCEEILIRQSATMQKGTIHKEMFLAVASSLTDQLAQSVFANPVYMGVLQQSDSFIDPEGKAANLNIELDFRQEGIGVKMYSGNMKQEQLIPYAALFSTRLK